ncbi:MAG: hypothetical protein ABSF37_05520 [Sedimentisphaerales bacterium]|jgi:hypothetical protein
MKKLLIIAVVALMAAPAMAGVLASNSCAVNLKLMQMGTVVAPGPINVTVTAIDATGMGASSGLDFGTFRIGTNLVSYQLGASITPVGSWSGGNWTCKLQGDPDAQGFNSSIYIHAYNNGPLASGTPFNVFVKVTNVNMTAIAFSPAFAQDATLTLTMSTM